MLGLPHVATLCSYLSFYYLYLCPGHTQPPNRLMKLVMTHWSEQWLSLKMKTRLETELVFHTGRHGCVTAEGGEIWGWLAFFDPKLSPVQLASLVAFKITKLPFPHISCPLPHVWPPPPYTSATFHIRAPINILNSSVYCHNYYSSPISKAVCLSHPWKKHY